MAILGALTFSTTAVAQSANQPTIPSTAKPAATTPLWPTYVVPGQPEVSRLYHEDAEVLLETSQRWTLISGSNPAGLGEGGLPAVAATHYAAVKSEPLVVIDNTLRDTGPNIVFNVYGSVPSGTYDGLAMGEAFLEGMFGDDVTVSINLSFEDMGGGGVIGATASSYVNDVSYSSSRNGLVSDMDYDDEVQAWLPTGSTVPVRYNGSSSYVSNESRIQWTKANYRAAIGFVSGTAAEMTFNTQFPFDFDPSNGVAGGNMSFVDVLIHEVGHALGFVSAADWTYYSAMTSLDLFRFQRSDGSHDYNPDDYAEFQTTPRLVDYNNPDDDHISDLGLREYRMSDGDPRQASHFREGGAWIGLMDPTFSYGETHYPNYFSAADINMFDAIGWDYPACRYPRFTQQPENQSDCEGGTVELSVEVDISSPAFQWRRGSVDLVDDGQHIFGATTSTLRIVGLTPADAANSYYCVATNLDDGCAAPSNYASVAVIVPISITDQPDDLELNIWEHALFEVAVDGGAPMTFRWHKNGVPLENGGNIYFADTRKLVILSVTAPDQGQYHCVISNDCGVVESDAARLTVIGATVPGDLNCDGEVDFGDINPFVMALSNPAGYAAAFPDCSIMAGDINADGKVDFGDINPFVSLLAGP